MGRLLGIDYGEVRIGLAISDEEQKFSFEFEIWDPGKFEKEIQNLVIKKEITKIILGLPLNMSGESTKKTEEVMEFKKKLEAMVSVPVLLIDERLSSKMASTIAGSEKNIDSLAAQIFLQNYLNKNNNENA
jgi:putative Holliday junction resolvase